MQTCSVNHVQWVQGLAYKHLELRGHERVSTSQIQGHSTADTAARGQDTFGRLRVLLISERALQGAGLLSPRTESLLPSFSL